MSENLAATKTSHKKKRITHRLDSAGWALFLMWVGVSLLMDLSWGVGLVGVFAIMFLGQAARRSLGLKLQWFWVVVGLLFLLGGVWELTHLDVDLMPIVLILAGGALMMSLFRRGSRSDWRGWIRDNTYRGTERWPCCSWSTDERRYR